MEEYGDNSVMIQILEDWDFPQKFDLSISNFMKRKCKASICF